MTIYDIKEILSSYFSEKGLDSLSSKVRDLLERKKIKDNISDEIKRALSDFENANRNEEFDFQGLIELVKGFDDKDFLIAYTIAFSELDKLEKAKEQIFDICIRDTHANTQDAKNKVKHILDNCYSIVEESLKLRLENADWIEIGLINKHGDENAQKIMENSNQNAEKILEGVQDYTKEVKELVSSIVSPTIQPVCTSPANDNQAYLNAFKNPLFLEEEEEDENIISLADMYISPSIDGKDIKATECIMKWYGTKIKPCLLLYGNAGVGKSSFVSKVLADAYGISVKSDDNFKFAKNEIMVVALRNHTDKVNNVLTAKDKKKFIAKEILSTLFSCDSVDQLKDKLIILDGLDELCVLIPGFDGQSFLSELSSLGTGFHVLVTSREAESYFIEPNGEAGLKTERLVWDKKQIKGWLKLYKGKKPHMTKWCFNFYKQFRSLRTDDKRSEIFCVPIILYICAKSETDLKSHSNIGSIYQDAFRNILLRKYIQGQHNTYELKEADKESNLIAWQYTKELAYQMFLLNTLDLVDDIYSEDRRAIGFRNAQKRTEDILKEEYNIINPNLELKKELTICPFAKEKGNGGITFAHKTVYEYFTAVKLYEDYFAKFNKVYFKNHMEEAPVDVINESIKAFRYKAIPNEIFRYLNEMDYVPFGRVYGKSTDGFDSKGFINGYIDGMKQHLFAKIGIEPAIEEYLYPPQINNLNCKESNNQWMLNSLNVQISRSYANLTWFLTGHGFTNEQDVHESVEVGKLLTGTDNTANFCKWNFTSANLYEAELSGSNMRHVYLYNTNLEGAQLLHTDLSFSIIKNSHFINADLKSAELKSATFLESDFRGANLYFANLRAASFSNSTFRDASLKGTYLTATKFRTVIDWENADFTGAKYSTDKLSITEFPDDFDPKEYDMIEVDISGNPVKE